MNGEKVLLSFPVSTHSRPKAAGTVGYSNPLVKRFQHTAARRRLESFADDFGIDLEVSTHSRPKAAGNIAESE